jgi:hypothetical protein
MPPAGFEPTIPASERPHTHVLDRAATGIGSEADSCCCYAVIFEGGLVSNIAD